MLLRVTLCHPSLHVIIEGHITELRECWIKPALYGPRIETLRVNVHGQEVTCTRSREKKLEYTIGEDKVSTMPPTS